MRKKLLVVLAPLAVAAVLALPAAPVLAAPNPPFVTKLEPNFGPPSGGTSVTITGTNFTGATAVDFGGIPATSFTVNSETSITAVSPSHVTGGVDVMVMTPQGWNTQANGANLFNYGPTVTKLEPNIGPPSGGTSVTITGTNFTGATAVHFGSTASKSFTVNSETSITAVSPSGVPGFVEVTVTTKEGTSGESPGDRFGYGPIITKLEPGFGPPSGGTSVTITGTTFTGATAVTFGGIPATSFTVNSETSITAVSPAHGEGLVDVRVTTPEWTSQFDLADAFEYITQGHEGHEGHGLFPVKRWPKVFSNAKKLGTAREPVMYYGGITLHNGALGNLTCENLVAGVTYNETTEGTEKGLLTSTGYTTYNCKAQKACKVTNTKGEKVEGIYATAESPPEPAGTEAHPTGVSSLPWTGEYIERETDKTQVLTHHVKIWIVIPPKTAPGAEGECLGLEIPFEDAEGTSEKEEGYELAPTAVNGKKNGLQPSHSEFLGETGRTEKGFPITGRLKSGIGDGFMLATKLVYGGLKGGWELMTVQ